MCPMVYGLCQQQNKVETVEFRIRVAHTFFPDCSKQCMGLPYVPTLQWSVGSM